MKPLKEQDILIGEKFGRLTLISWEIDGRYRKGKFYCDCGNTTVKYYSHVKNGLTTSCGCLQRELASKRKITHGMTKTVEFRIWQGMISRCYSKKNKKYYRYGGRGIIVCDRWRNNFENFYEDMGNRPSLRHSIERINNNGNYSPDNCRWDISFSQSRNTSRNHWIEHNGERLILQDWADRLGYSQPRMSTMIKKMKIHEIIEMSIKKGRKPILERKNKKGDILIKK